MTTSKRGAAKKTAPVARAAAPPDAPTLDERLKVLTGDDSTYERQPMEDGTIRMRITKADGDTVSGNGATTEEAVANLESKMGGAK